MEDRGAQINATLSAILLTTSLAGVASISAAAFLSFALLDAMAERKLSLFVVCCWRRRCCTRCPKSSKATPIRSACSPPCGRLVAHEFPTEIGDFVVLLNAGDTRRRAYLFNLLCSAMALAGSVIGDLTLGSKYPTTCAGHGAGPGS